MISYQKFLHPGEGELKGENKDGGSGEGDGEATTQVSMDAWG